MSPLEKKESKIPIWVAIIGAMGVIVAALIAAGALHLHPHPKEHINGVASDALNQTPLPGIVVRLETNEGQLLTQDTTDRDGEFSLAIPDGLTTVRIVAEAPGYVPYDKKLPAQESKNNIQFARQPISFGIPDGTSIDGALQTIAGKLNVTIVFSKSCTRKGATAVLNGGELQGDRRMPEAIIKDLLSRVKGNTVRYDVIAIEEGKRYEVRCF